MIHLTIILLVFVLDINGQRYGRYIWSNGWSQGQNIPQQGVSQTGFYPPQRLPPYQFPNQYYPSLYSQPISDCPTTDGNRTGICVASTGECISRGGRPLGGCFATPQSGSNIPEIGISQGNQWQNPGIPIGVCCFFQVTCGGTIIQNGTYFRNPNAPAPYTDTRSCSATVQIFRRDVCQLRLDFLTFDIGRPTAGNCEADRFVVSGQSPNSIVPPICGHNSQLHMYVEIAQSYGPITLNFLTMGNRNRAFDIRVTYISCASIYRAPNNCLQYYYGVQGNLRSFNYEEFNPQASGYLNNMDYTICFRKEPGFCTITYSVPIQDFNINTPNQPNVPNPFFNPNAFFQIIADRIGTDTVGMEQAGAGPYDCSTDYLILRETRLCGNRLNAQLYPPTPHPTVHAEVLDNTTGPIYARFVSNHQEVSRGFNINYRMNPCLINGKKIWQFMYGI